MRGVRIPAAVVGLLLAACSGEDVVENAEGRLLVTPNTLVFERGYVGFEVEAPVRLQNTGQTELTVEVAIEGPFFTAAGPYRLRGGADVTKAIVFTPAAAGEFTGVVRYTDRGETFEVALVGHATVPEPCNAPDSCHEAVFDPETGSCEVRPKKPGDACETGTPCLTDGRCEENGERLECRGTPLDCNDHNACTDDACNTEPGPAGGCQHTATVCTITVGEGKDPRCLRPSCRPDSGCYTAEETDGKGCDVPLNGGCVEQVCRMGACIRDVQDPGHRCNTTCGAGACEDRESEEGGGRTSVCIRDTPGSLDAAPTFATTPVAADREIVFPGLVADDGTVLWLEPATDGSNTLLAAVAPTEDGEAYELRYRNAVLAGVPGHAGPLLTLDRVLVLLRGADGTAILEARRRADGVAAWEPLDLATVVPFDFVRPIEPVALVDGGDGRFHVVLQTGGRTVLLFLGSEVPPVALDGTVVTAAGEPGVVADADGRLYFTLAGADGARVVTSLYADYTVRWQQPADEGEGGVVAVAQGLLVTSPGHVRNTDDGFPVSGLPFVAGEGAAGPAPAPILGDHGFAIVPEPGAPASLVSFDPLTREPLASRELSIEGVPGSTLWTAPVLTTRDNALVALQVLPGGDVGAALPVSQLVEVDEGGDDARACLVPGLLRLAGPPALPRGWFALGERHGAVKLYQMNKSTVNAASGGWIGPGGGPRGGNREVR